MRDGLETGLPKELQGTMSAANKIYRNLIPINKAASARSDEVITPRNLQRAMARQQRTDVSRMNDPLVDNATNVLTGTVPDSGTAGRMMMMGAGAGAGGAAGAAGVPGVLPVMAMGGLSMLGSLRWPQQAMLGNTALQRALQPYGHSIAGMAGAASRPTLLPDEDLAELKRRSLQRR
jgi:hypothetical protein